MAIRTFFFVPFAMAMMPASALAATSDELKTLLDRQPAVSDDALAGMRAGFVTAGGAQFDFGASIKTMVNGQLALQTSLKWTDAGAVTQQLTGLGQSIQSKVNDTVASNLAKAGVNSGAASPAGNTVSNNATNNTASPVNAADPVNSPAASAVEAANNVAAAPAAMPSAAASPSPAATPAESSPAPTNTAASTPTSTPAIVTGVEVPGAGGSTQVFANLSPTQIQNIILNSASNQNITQNTDITFTIYNFQAWQQQLAEHTMAARLAGEMMAASGFAGGH